MPPIILSASLATRPSRRAATGQECCFLYKLDSLTSPTFSSAPLIWRLPIMLEFCFSTSNSLNVEATMSPVVHSNPTLFQVTLQHSSLRFDFSHTNLCESIRCVVPSGFACSITSTPSKLAAAARRNASNARSLSDLNNNRFHPNPRSHPAKKARA